MLGNKNYSGLQITDYRLQIRSFKILLMLCTLFSVFCPLLLAQEQFTYDAKGKRDPFIPLVTSDGRLLKLEDEGSASELLLEGIIYDEHGMSYAIVNGSVVKIGDEVCNYQVLKIEKNRVSFIKEGQITKIELKKSNEDAIYGTK